MRQLYTLTSSSTVDEAAVRLDILLGDGLWLHRISNFLLDPHNLHISFYGRLVMGEEDRRMVGGGGVIVGKWA